MTRVLLVLVIACASCGKPTTSARESVLAAMPADASAIFVAEGAALGHPRFRPIIEALRSRWPASLGCVIDAALVAVEVAAATTRDGTTIVISGRATPSPCTPLSKVGELWIATIGNGRVARAGVPSILVEPRFARAKQHLMSAPIAATLESSRFHTTIHASAQPEPLSAWVAFDAEPAVAGVLELSIRALVERMAHDSSTSTLASHVRVTRDASQIVARVHGTPDTDLGAAARTLVTWGWGQTAQAKPAAWPCPPLTGLVVGCTTGLELSVSSIDGVAGTLEHTTFAPIVTNGAVTGLRLTADLSVFGLVRGDIVFACSGRPIVSRDALLEIIRTDPSRASIAVRRDGVDSKLVFARAK